MLTIVEPLSVICCRLSGTANGDRGEHENAEFRGGNSHDRDKAAGCSIRDPRFSILDHLISVTVPFSVTGPAPAS